MIFPSIKASQRAFTLVEMLVVVCIMVMLMVFTIMAIGSMGMERRVAAAGSMTSDLLSNARQLSRSKNTLAMVAMVNSGTDAGRMLTTLVYSSTNNQWSQVSGWHRFPEGVAIDQSTSLFLAPPASATLSRAGTAILFSCATFLPDGRLSTTGTVPQVLFLRPITTVTTGANYYKIIVNDATGVPITRRP